MTSSEMIERRGPGAVLLRLLAVGLLGLGLAVGAGCSGAVKGAVKESATSTGWKVIGPGGGGGLFDPTVDPSDPSHVVMRCDMTAGYYTRDDGRSWGLFNLWTVVTDFEFAPASSGTVYASTRGYLHDEDRGSGLSLLCRSRDGGVHWEIVYPDPLKFQPLEKLQSLSLLPSQMSPGLPDRSIDKVRVDPADANRIYLGMSPLLPYIPLRGEKPEGEAILMASSDCGVSWSQTAALPGSKVLALVSLSGAWQPGALLAITDSTCVEVKADGETVIHPLPAGRAQSAEGGVGGDGAVVLYVLTRTGYEGSRLEGGLFRSRDLGVSWEPVNAGILTAIQNERVKSFASFAVCEGAPEHLYLAGYSLPADDAGRAAGDHEFILRSRDSGVSWSTVYLADSRRVLSGNYEGSWLGRDYGPGWGGVPISMGVSPTDPEVCYGTDYGRAYRTLDGGKSWRQVYSINHPDSSCTGTGLDVICCYGLHFDPFDPKHLAISYIDVGLFQSYDGGESWFHNIEGIPENWVNTCYWAEFDPAVKGRMWSVWANVHSLPRRSQFAPGRFQKGLGGVALSEDSGRTWRKSCNGLPEHSVVTHILVDPASPEASRTLYACVFDQGVYKSTDGGASWNLCAKGLGEHPYAWETRLAGGRLYCLCVRGWPDNDTVVDGGLYVSEDAAASWQRMELPAGVNAPSDLLIDPADPGRMYLSCWPRTVEGKDICGGLYCSGDGGKSWKQTFDESCRVYAAALDPQDPATVYINTFQNAAYRSTDRGETWKHLEGYRFKWGHRPVPDPHHPGMLYLTTYGGSVFYGPSAGVPGAGDDLVNMPPAWW